MSAAGAQRTSAAPTVKGLVQEPALCRWGPSLCTLGPHLEEGLWSSHGLHMCPMGARQCALGSADGPTVGVIQTRPRHQGPVCPALWCRLWACSHLSGPSGPGLRLSLPAWLGRWRERSAGRPQQHKWCVHFHTLRAEAGSPATGHCAAAEQVQTGAGGTSGVQTAGLTLGHLLCPRSGHR